MSLRLLSSFYVAAILLPHGIHAFRNCPLLGPDFPSPTNLSSSSVVKAASSNLTTALEDAIATGNTTYGLFEASNTSFSLGIFSALDRDFKYEYHYSAPILSDAESGTSHVDANTIYRVGSLTKLFSVYTFLVEAGDMQFNDPITKYVPELLQAAQTYNASEDPLDFVSWEDVTIGELASHTAGIGRDYSLLGEQSVLGTNGVADGLPALNNSEIPPCSSDPLCTRAQYFAGFTKRHPFYTPGTGAIYSNTAFQILGYALENITGKPFATMFEESLKDPLNLTSTFWSLPPDNSTAIIPNGDLLWAVDLGDESPAGSIYTTLNDAISLGRSILSSTLLTTAQTRRWMKPRAFVSDASQAVGAPWEIRRIQVGQNARVVDLYGKSGDLTGYSCLLVLIPDWDVGYAILSAGSAPDLDVGIVADIVTDTFPAAVEAVAEEQAARLYAGTYNSTDPTLNSSLTISADPALPGLGITRWISNGTDMLTSATAFAIEPRARLYPTRLSSKTADGRGERVGFRAVFESADGSELVQGPWGNSCQTWASADAAYWGGIASDEFVFVLDRDGVVVRVEPRITRASLAKL